MKIPRIARWGFPVIIALVILADLMRIQRNAELNQEFYLEYYSGAKELTPGTPLYDDFAALAHQCGSQSIPRFYVEDNILPFNSFYLVGSRFPYRLRPGKIYLSKEFATLLSRDALRGIIAHELGHRDRDFSGILDVFPFSFEKPRNLIQEKAADAFQANCVGKRAAIATWEELIKLQSNPDDARLSKDQRNFLLDNLRNGALKKSVDELLVRIEAIKKLKQP